MGRSYIRLFLRLLNLSLARGMFNGLNGLKTDVLKTGLERSTHIKKFIKNSWLHNCFEIYFISATMINLTQWFR